MRRNIINLMFILMLFMGFSSKTAYASAEEQDEYIEKAIAEENADVERFNGFSRDIVWQVFCTEMYQIFNEEEEYGLWEDYYLEKNGYELKISVTSIYAKEASDMDEKSIERWENGWSNGFKTDVVPEDTKYYKLMAALENYVLTQRMMGEPVYFNYTDDEQAVFDEFAKQGYIPEYFTNNGGKELTGAVTAEPEEQYEEDIENSNTEKSDASDKVVSFFLGGGITLVLMFIAGAVYLVAYRKRKKEEFE